MSWDDNYVPGSDLTSAEQNDIIQAIKHLGPLGEAEKMHIFNRNNGNQAFKIDTDDLGTYLYGQNSNSYLRFDNDGNLRLRSTNNNITIQASLEIDAFSTLDMNGNAITGAGAGHDQFSDFVADEHIGHSGVTLTAGNGLTGGGTIDANRTFTVGSGTGISVAADAISTNDSEIVHDNLSGFVANEHIDHLGVSITAGSHLTGGGDISATRTLDVSDDWYDSVSDIPTATPTNGDITHLSTCDQIYDWVNGNYSGTSHNHDLVYLKLAGGTMTGGINMDNQGISNLNNITTSTNTDLHLAPDGTGVVRIESNAIKVGGVDRGIYINDDETYIGHGAGDSNAGGWHGTLIGHDAGHAITTGNDVTCLGYEAGKVATTPHMCTFIGSLAGADSTTPHSSTMIGAEAGQSITTGFYNTMVGKAAGKNNAVGVGNCAFFGYEAGKNNTQNEIVAVGYLALINNAGQMNTAVGCYALDANVTGMGNSGIGWQALTSLTTGSNNVAAGSNALQDNSIGACNVGIGVAAMSNNSSGNYNVGIGQGTLNGNTQGSNNSAIGYNAAIACANNLVGCDYFGYQAGKNNAASNRLYINNSDSAFPLIYGEFDNDIVKIGNNSDDFGLIFDVNTAGVGKIYGGDDTGDDLWLYPNTTDSYQYIKMFGGVHNIEIYAGNNTDGGDIKMKSRWNSFHFLVNDDTIAGRIEVSGTSIALAAYTGSNNDIKLIPDGTGKVNFGTYTATPATDSTGYIEIKDAGGTTRKLMVQA